MPVYTYRREDGTTFDLRQKFSDDPLSTDPETGQRVVRVVQAAGVIFKGSGFYINDSKGASKSSALSSSKKDGAGDGATSDAKPEAKPDTTTSAPAAKEAVAAPAAAAAD
jgi:putative FmdB family regulatory protein